MRGWILLLYFGLFHNWILLLNQVKCDEEKDIENIDRESILPKATRQHHHRQLEIFESIEDAVESVADAVPILVTTTLVIPALLSSFKQISSALSETFNGTLISNYLLNKGSDAWKILNAVSGSPFNPPGTGRLPPPSPPKMDPIPTQGPTSTVIPALVTLEPNPLDYLDEYGVAPSTTNVPPSSPPSFQQPPSSPPPTLPPIVPPAPPPPSPPSLPPSSPPPMIAPTEENPRPYEQRFQVPPKINNVVRPPNSKRPNLKKFPQMTSLAHLYMSFLTRPEIFAELQLDNTKGFSDELLKAIHMAVSEMRRAQAESAKKRGSSENQSIEMFKVIAGMADREKYYAPVHRQDKPISKSGKPIYWNNMYYPNGAAPDREMVTGTEMVDGTTSKPIRKRRRRRRSTTTTTTLPPEEYYEEEYEEEEEIKKV